MALANGLVSSLDGMRTPPLYEGANSSQKFSHEPLPSLECFGPFGYKGQQINTTMIENIEKTAMDPLSSNSNTTSNSTGTDIFYHMFYDPSNLTSPTSSVTSTSTSTSDFNSGATNPGTLNSAIAAFHDNSAYSSHPSVLSFEQETVSTEVLCAGYLNYNIDNHDNEYAWLATDTAGQTKFQIEYGNACPTLTEENTVLQPDCVHKRRLTDGDIPSPKKQCGAQRTKDKSSPSKDPQSLAAKNRRERISERLKVLQDLIPNGTKVDMVTMLEKAFNYVKFLQLQVKVLSTDEFWPAPGGKAPELSQVKDVIDAILSNQEDKSTSCKI